MDFVEVFDVRVALPSCYAEEKGAIFFGALNNVRLLFFGAEFDHLTGSKQCSRIFAKIVKHYCG